MDNKTFNELFVRLENRVEKIEKEVRELDKRISELDKKHDVHIVDVSWSFKLLYILLGIAALGQIKADSWIAKLIENFFSKIFFR